MLVVQVLGQLRVWHGTNEIPLGPPGRRALLGLLVLAGDRPVTRAELVDALWGDAPPPSVTNVVQFHIMHLRRALEPARSARSPSHRIRTVGDGYRLITEDASVDLIRFRELVGRNLREAARLRDFKPHRAFIDDPKISGKARRALRLKSNDLGRLRKRAERSLKLRLNGEGVFLWLVELNHQPSVR